MGSVNRDHRRDPRQWERRAEIDLAAAAAQLPGSTDCVLQWVNGQLLGLREIGAFGVCVL
jgi:hypothetical protein